MNFGLKTRTMAILALAYVFIPVASLNGAAMPQTKKGLKGKIVDNIYTSPERDYHVAVPNISGLGATARDEGDKEVWQVIFTDDLGGFYRLLSLKSPKGEYSADRVLTMEQHAAAFDKEIVNTARGREVRFVNREKAGAEITITTSRKLPDGSIVWDTKKPDLVTANVAFEANEHLYHLIAGVPQTEKTDQQTAVTRAKQRLEKFLSGFELIKPRK